MTDALSPGDFALFLLGSGEAAPRKRARDQQADAAGLYDPLYQIQRGIVEVGCWMHGRRGFFEARTAELRRDLPQWVRASITMGRG